MVYWLILFPLVMAAATFALPSNRWRPWLVPVGALGQLVLALTAIRQPGATGLDRSSRDQVRIFLRNLLGRRL